jgi:hypothetical protein
MALAHWQRDFVAAELGLGLQTYSFAAEDRDGGRISGDAGDAPALADRLRSLRRAGRTTALWLGASQLHAINRPGPEAKLAVWVAEERARTRHGDVAYTQLSLPNAGLLELLAAYQAFRATAVRPDQVVLAFTYDDLSETALREDVIALLDTASPDLAPTGGPESEAARILQRAREETRRERRLASASAPVERSATAGTPQERLERSLVSRLETHWPAYAERHRLRSAGVAAWKLPLTSLVFHLRGRPVQRVDPGARVVNEEALGALIAQTRADGVALLVYKAPHRPGAERFYHDRNAYDAFHAELEALSAREGFAYLDLEELVPGETFGLTDQFLPDVFHFREEGHRLLGTEIDRWFEERGH